jgi:alpha-galactosidase/6-phospho-beta-glucosidase family protein
MVKNAKTLIQIHLTLNRKEALKDADFVITQFRVGLLEARMNDERIPLKYGVIGQETNGPGGLFKDCGNEYVFLTYDCEKVAVYKVRLLKQGLQNYGRIH